jgi:hypothetical protein
MHKDGDNVDDNNMLAVVLSVFKVQQHIFLLWWRYLTFCVARVFDPYITLSLLYGLHQMFWLEVKCLLSYIAST